MNKNTLGQLTKKSSAPYQQSMPKLHFLCSHHRDWVYFNSPEAIQYLVQIKMKGEFLLQHHQYSEALPYIGSAWETADILMELSTAEHMIAVQRFTCLSALLEHCFQQLKHTLWAEQVCSQTAHSLENLLAQLPLKSEAYFYTIHCIEQLSKPVKDRSAFRPVSTTDISLLRH